MTRIDGNGSLYKLVTDSDLKPERGKVVVSINGQKPQAWSKADWDGYKEVADSSVKQEGLDL